MRVVLSQDWSGTGRGDPGALAVVVEHPYARTPPGPQITFGPPLGRDATWYEVTHLDRSTRPLMEQEAELLRQWRTREGSVVVMDPIGVGYGIAERWRQRGWPHARVVFTGGLEARGLHIPKGLAFGQLVALAEAGRLKVAPGVPYAEQLREEMRSFRCTVTEAGHLQFAAGSGATDDLLCAVAVAVVYLEAVPLARDEQPG